MIVRISQLRRLIPVVFIVLASLFLEDEVLGAESSVKKFVSTKSSEVNVRTGPGYNYPVKHVYYCRNYPLKIIARFEHWRKVEDIEGRVGWSHISVISNIHYVILKKKYAYVYRWPIQSSPKIAKVSKDSIAKLLNIRKNWCMIEIEGIKGWVQKIDLWGI